MHKKKIFLFAVLFLILSSSLVYGQDYTNPLIIVDDNSSVDWHNPYSWTITEETTYYKTGSNSLKIEIPASSQYKNVYIDFQADLTEYDYLAFWFKGNNSGATLRIDLTTTVGVSAYYYWEADDRLGWEFIEKNIDDDLSQVGGPDISDINYFTISMASNNANPITLYFDWVIVSIGDPQEGPSEDPELTEYSLNFESFFIGEWAFIGVIVWILLGVAVMKINKYSGVFVFVLSMLYLLVLYDTLDKFGNNIYYMIVILFYSLFSVFLTVLVDN